MKALLYGALIALLCTACHKSIVQPDRYSYKGDKLHAQPSVEIFPNENSFILSGFTDSVLSDTLTSNIRKILSDHDIAGITITMLIPDKGIWQYDAGYLLLALAHHQGLVVDAHYSMPLGAGNIVSNSKETQTICAISVNQNIPVEAIAFSMMGKITEVARASGSFDTENRDTDNGLPHDPT